MVNVCRIDEVTTIVVVRIHNGKGGLLVHLTISFLVRKTKGHSAQP